MGISFKGANHIIKKNLGKAMLYYNTPAEQMITEVTKSFNENRSYTKPETIHLIHRKLEVLPPGKGRNKYWEDVIRYYDQRRVGFFVCHVLAKRKIAIPLR